MSSTCNSESCWELGKVKGAQSCPTLCYLMDYTVHGILQAEILEWVAFPFSRKGQGRSLERTGFYPYSVVQIMEASPGQTSGSGPSMSSLPTLGEGRKEVFGPGPSLGRGGSSLPCSTGAKHSSLVPMTSVGQEL